MRNKLQLRSIIGIFISYDKYTKGYKIYFHHFKKIIISRNVIFEENKFIDYKKTQDENLTNKSIEIEISIEEVQYHNELSKLQV